MADPNEHLVAAATHLYSAVLSDCLDALGRTEQVLSSRLRPLDPEMRLVGHAETIQIAEVFAVSEEPYRGIMEAVDGARPGSVIVVAGTTARCALWGELFSTAAQARGARGTLLDGYTRDIERIVRQRYPVFAAGSRPIDLKGRAQFRAAGGVVEIDGIRIAPGDLVFGDRDGVVVVPQDVESAVLALAYEKVGKEDLAREALRAGSPIQQVWQDHGVL
jgi:regulator of RNase E activity RraA